MVNFQIKKKRGKKMAKASVSKEDVKSAFTDLFVITEYSETEMPIAAKSLPCTGPESRVQ